jgi:hypothetical protein
MTAKLQRQGEYFDRLAKEFGLAAYKELLIRPLQYRWDLIERDINNLRSRRRDLPAGHKEIIPDALVNYLAVRYLSCCLAENRPPPQKLVHLISQQLESDRFGVKPAKDSELIQAQDLRNEDPTLSDSVIATTVGVNKSTVSRWVRDGLLPPKS